MLSKSYLTRCLSVAVLFSAGMSIPSQADAGFIHYVTITNPVGSGVNATDLEVSVMHTVAHNSAKDFSSQRFSSVTFFTLPNPDHITYLTPKIGPVLPGQSDTIGFITAPANTTLTGATWTSPTKDFMLPPTDVVLLQVSFNVTDNPDGTKTVAVDNETGSAVAYSSLQAYTGASLAFDNAQDALANATTGAAVSLLPGVSSSGIFQPGITDFITFTPAPDGYSAWSVLIDGNLFGEATVVPEPSALTLLGLGSLGLLGYGWRRRMQALA